MFSHVMVGTNDIEETKIFYDKLLGVLGVSPGVLSPNLTGQKGIFMLTIILCLLLLSQLMETKLPQEMA